MGTVEGFRRVLMCEEVRQEAIAVVGEAGLAAFLQRLVEGRLLPTSWLNQVRFFVFQPSLLALL